MKRFISMSLAFIMLLCTLIPSGMVTFAKGDTVNFKIDVTENYDYANGVLKLVNKEREANGASPLAMDDGLLETAMLRASECIANFDHTRPNLESCFSANIKMDGENIALGYQSPEDVMSGWMSSPGHRANILDGDYKAVGIGCVRYGYSYYWVQCFGANLPAGSDKHGTIDKTAVIEMDKSIVQLYYNSMSSFADVNYPKGFGTVVVCLNPGAEGRCFTVTSDELNYSSSNEKIFTVDKSGVIHTKKSGSATFKATLKADSSIFVEQEITTTHTHSYKKSVTKATLTADGKITNTCSACGTKKTTVIPKASTIKLSATSYTYDGKVKTPSVTVKDSNGKTLVKNTDYTVSYASGRKNVGKYAVKITFKGNYSGTKTLYFTIKPKGTSISSVSAQSKAFTVKWKKQATQTTGYQIQYSTSSKFTNAKTVTVSNNGTTSKKITKLTGNKKYYIRVRTYKTVSGTKYYSSWSGAKNVTTKK